jgi:hypothetical protein
MVDIVLLAASCTLELDHQQQRNLTRMEQQAKPLQGNETEWAGSRERFSSSRQGGAFFLTSLFIELIDPQKGEQTAQSCANACLQKFGYILTFSAK